MPTYDKPLRLLVRDLVTALGVRADKSFTRTRAIARFQEHYPREMTETVRTRLAALSANAPSRVHHNADGPDDSFVQIDRYSFRLDRPDIDPTPIDRTDGPGTGQGIADGKSRKEVLEVVLGKEGLCLGDEREFDPGSITDARKRVLASIVRRRGRDAFRRKVLKA